MGIFAGRWGRPLCVHDMQAFKKAGAVIIGVSGDDYESHANFKSKLGLPYTLLADEGNKVAVARCSSRQ